MTTQTKLIRKKQRIMEFADFLKNISEHVDSTTSLASIATTSRKLTKSMASRD